MTTSVRMAPASWPLSYRLSGDNAGLRRQFSTLLYSCGFLASTDPGGITIEVGSATSANPEPSRYQSIFNWRDLRIGKDSERVRFNYRDWDLELNLISHTVRCWGPDCDVLDGLSFRELFLLSPMLFLLHTLGYFEMHAAACEIEQSGYLFVGPSGSGKTSSVLSLIALGARYVSDDAIVVSRSSTSSSLCVRGLRRSFSLKNDYLQHCPDLAAYTTEPLDGSEKRRIDPRQIWPAQHVSSVEPKFIIACKVVDQDTSEIVSISKPEALARLVASTPWIGFDELSAPDQLDIFRSLAESCRTFELRAGRDVFRNGDRLISFLGPSVLA